MRVLMYEPPLCTLHELQTIYDLEDFYDFLEMIEIKEALKADIIKDKPKPGHRNK